MWKSAFALILELLESWQTLKYLSFHSNISRFAKDFIKLCKLV
jgi:hypothetical protein